MYTAVAVTVFLFYEFCEPNAGATYWKCITDDVMH